jgi:hypothetical protein
MFYSDSQKDHHISKCQTHRVLSYYAPEIEHKHTESLHSTTSSVRQATPARNPRPVKPRQQFVVYYTTMRVEPHGGVGCLACSGVSRNYTTCYNIEDPDNSPRGLL